MGIAERAPRSAADDGAPVLARIKNPILSLVVGSIWGRLMVRLRRSVDGQSRDGKGAVSGLFPGVAAEGGNALAPQVRGVGRGGAGSLPGLNPGDGHRVELLDVGELTAVTGGEHDIEVSLRIHGGAVGLGDGSGA